MTVPIVGQDEAEGDCCCINKTEELSLTFGKTKKCFHCQLFMFQISK
jgi:hypothetical protein